MKVIINACYGCYSLSDECKKALAAKKGHTAYEYTCYRDRFCRYKPEVNKFFKVFLLDIDQEEVSHEEASKHKFKSLFKDGEERTDLDLISLIEENGSEWASGEDASLKIVEIPDDIEWFIEDDDGDGDEWITEVPRTWR